MASAKKSRFAERRTLRNNEIENLPEKIKRWCVYENAEEGCYHYGDVTITEYDNGIVQYDIDKPYGTYRVEFYDSENIYVSKKDNNFDNVFNYIYVEDDKTIDDRSDSRYRIITFKNPESKVAWRSISKNLPSYILVTYRNGDQKFIDLFDEND